MQRAKYHTWYCTGYWLSWSSHHPFPFLWWCKSFLKGNPFCPWSWVYQPQIWVQDQASVNQRESTPFPHLSSRSEFIPEWARDSNQTSYILFLRSLSLGLKGTGWQPGGVVSFLWQRSGAMLHSRPPPGLLELHCFCPSGGLMSNSFCKSGRDFEIINEFLCLIIFSFLFLLLLLIVCW